MKLDLNDNNQVQNMFFDHLDNINNVINETCKSFKQNTIDIMSLSSIISQSKLTTESKNKEVVNRIEAINKILGDLLKHLMSKAIENKTNRVTLKQLGKGIQIIKDNFKA